MTPVDQQQAFNTQVYPQAQQGHPQAFPPAHTAPKAVIQSL